MMGETPLSLTDVPAGWDAILIGKTRPSADGEAVTGLVLDHHPDLAPRALGWIRDEAIRCHKLSRAVVLHRVGPIAPGQVIVVCAAWSARAEDADAACRWMLEATKRHLPVWKREVREGGRNVWLEGHPLEWPWREAHA